MKMKTIAGAALAFTALAITPTLQAQPQQQPPERRDRPQRPERRERPEGPRAQSPEALGGLQAALDSLNLTEDQKSKAAEMIKAARERFDAARQQLATAQGEDRREATRKLAEVSRNLTEELTGILDEDQKALFRQKLEQGRQALRDRVAAPGPRPAEGGPRPLPFDRAIEQATSGLQLTDDQKQKIQALSSDLATRTQALHEEARKQLKTILTEDQFKQFEQTQPRPGLAGPRDGEPRRPGIGAGGGPAGAVERIRDALAQLQLTEDQKTRLKPHLDEFQKNMQELRSKIQDGGGPELRDKFLSTLQELRTNLQTILTPEQLEKVRPAIGQFGDGAGRPGNPERRDAPRRPRPGQVQN